MPNTTYYFQESIKTVIHQFSTKEKIQDVIAYMHTLDGSTWIDIEHPYVYIIQKIRLDKEIEKKIVELDLEFDQLNLKMRDAGYEFEWE